jgi:pimeloyl-ACP methyl ester carboxylesterase
MTEHFAVAVGEDVLADLKRRLEATRWPDEAPDAIPEHGFGLSAARELAEYWRDGYDWKAAEATLNSFEQGKAEGVHFIADGDGPPLLLLHGWPSSVWEFVRLLPLLREHARVIVPSLPGYGFSFTPGGQRSGIVECADQIHALMGALGHERYHVAGGDWGSSIAVRLAHAYPQAVRALHLYMMPLRRPETWPETEIQSRAALAKWLDEEGGYVHIQGTRPQTLAYGLQDSPVGLMSWIRRARRLARRRADDGDDLLGDRVHRLVVLAVLGAPARRLGARRRRRRRRPDRRAADLSGLPEGARPRAARDRRARLRDRALGDAGLRRALPRAGGDGRARRQPAAVYAVVILRTFSARAPRGVSIAAVSPTLRPTSARPTGESIDSVPAVGSASWADTIV